MGGKKGGGEKGEATEQRAGDSASYSCSHLAFPPFFVLLFFSSFCEKRLNYFFFAVASAEINIVMIVIAVKEIVISFFCSVTNGKPVRVVVWGGSTSEGQVQLAKWGRFFG